LDRAAPPPGQAWNLLATIPSRGGALDSNQRARTQVGKQLEDSRDERQEVLNAVRRGYENDDSDLVLGDVLLELEVLVGGEERVEFRACES
jgi:hypothetical protein